MARERWTGEELGCGPVKAERIRPAARAARSLVSVGVAGSLLLGPTVTAQQASSLNTAAIARRAGPATVTIVTLGPSADTLGFGSGFILRENGVIATSWHVLKGAWKAVVILPNGSRFDDVRFLGGDSLTDVALLKVPGSGLPALQSRPSVPAVGDPVVVVGSPLGLAQTVSDGILSAVREDGKRTLLQFTAPVSPGSSGGPVLDRSGRVTGLVRASLTEGQSLNFATPVRYALDVLASSTTPQPIREVFGNRRVNNSAAAFQVPPLATRIRSSVTGMFKLSTRLRLRGSDRQVQSSGLLVTTSSGEGWLFSGTSVEVVWRLTTNERGQVLLQTETSAFDGYQTDDGFYLVESDTTSGLILEYVATDHVLPLSVRTGVYAVETQTTFYDADGSRGSLSSWWGEAAILVTDASVRPARMNDSVYVMLSLRNAAGGTSGGWLRGRIPASGEFNLGRYYEDGRGHLLRGHVSRGSISAEWVDRRPGIGQFRGPLSGTRK